MSLRPIPPDMCRQLWEKFIRRAAAEQSLQLLSYQQCQCQEKVRINNGKTPGKYWLSRRAAVAGLCEASLSEEICRKRETLVCDSCG